MDDFKKKLENIWYYYKVPIIIIGLIIIVTLDIIITTKPEEKYDHSIAFIATNFPEEESLNKITDLFEKEYNKTFKLEIFNLDFNYPDQVEISRLDLDLGNKISDYLIVEDIEGFEKAIADNIIIEIAQINEIDFLKGNNLDNYYLVTRK